MPMTVAASAQGAERPRFSALLPTLAAILGVLGLAACGGTGKDEKAAYDVCMVSAKADPRVGKAAFAAQDKSNIQGSTGDAGIRVNIPYELDGKKGLFQCIAEKQTDGTFKVTN